ncbi:MAG: hypothetical protein JKX92_09870 [Porticoccaceae bacterium]|nr:hypothetical protein [Porticoccaceae bacterium]
MAVGGGGVDIDDFMGAGARVAQDAKADDCMDAGARVTQDAKADDCMDAGARVTQDAKAERTGLYSQRVMCEQYPWPLFFQF